MKRKHCNITNAIKYPLSFPLQTAVNRTHAYLSSWARTYFKRNYLSNEQAVYVAVLMRGVSCRALRRVIRWQNQALCLLHASYQSLPCLIHLL
jgi:hypothetical protein